MKLIKKGLVLSVAASLLVTPTMINAEADDMVQPIKAEIDGDSIQPISEEIIDEGKVEEGLKKEYIDFHGTISELDFNEGTISILVENDNEEPYNKSMFYLDDDVIFVNDETKDFVDMDSIEEGMDVTLYSHKSTPILESYPPQQGADVLVVRENEEPTNAEVFKFDEDLLSTDKVLKIHPDDETIIVDTKGNSLDVEDVKNRDAIVFYSIATLSLPAQTTPEKIIVLDEKKLEEMDKVIINDEEISLGKSMYKTEDGVVMVPLRQITEALGYEVIWNGEDRSVELTKGPHWFLIKIGEDDYNFARMKVQLGTIPELTESKTYVPLDFIELMGAKLGYTIDGVLKVIH